MKIKMLFGALVALATLAGCNAQQPASASLDDLFLTRRSIRNYEPGRTISEAQVRELLTAAQNAPSWANQQPSKYYVAISPEKHDAVLEMIGGNKDRVINAPVFIVSTFEKSKSGFFRGNPANDAGELWGAYDNGLSNAYLVLKARDMGFDTLIMGMREADKLRELFAIPENEAILAVIALGYRAEEPNMPVHRPLDEVVKFF
ncbi:MAG: nitroreductase family protein [Bacteroidales bacterium]|jgi:nitroreductase|nr:nitroreductase family protein [Bacteroidales bacterium]